VLLYHRVATLARDPWALAVAPERFDAQMALLRRRYRPMRVEELVDALARGRALPPRSVAVTFDDAYGDVVRNALPLLERHGVPGTVFAVSGMVDSAREFWWDEAERLVLDAPLLPPALVFRSDVGEETLAVPPDARPPLPRGLDETEWRAWANGAPTARHALYHTLWSRLQSLRASVRTAALDALRQQVGDHGEARVEQMPCSLAELRAFHTSALGDVGAHTVSHPELSALEVHEQAYEILHSRRSLETMLQSPVALFSYPFGHAHSYTAETERLVREAGFRGACLNAGGHRVRTGLTDPLRLPRLYVSDWDAATLAGQVDAVLGG
jgi:peptidoglycan/xylan/chitin deacetylase (PgdA/CDA1 family)